MTKPPRREELERRHRALSSNRPVWIALGFQLMALASPIVGAFAVMLMVTWLIVAALARWLTRLQLADLARKEQQEEADARDFIKDRSESIYRRMSATLEAQDAKARAEHMRNKMRLILDKEADRLRNAHAEALVNGASRKEKFMGDIIDITPEKS